MVFLSSSRVYPIEPLRALPLERTGSRLAIMPGRSGPGWSAAGIDADFPLRGWRSIYGATKLAAEMLILEYVHSYSLNIIVDRCGVLAGPWQMGKVDQGFVTLWAARHLYGGSLSYFGFGGEGLQVRDVLHVGDLYALLRRQLEQIAGHSGAAYNVGGGAGLSVSLLELAGLCRERAGRSTEIGSKPATHPTDVPYYVTDNTAISRATGWAPQVALTQLLDDIFAWLAANRATLQPILG